MPPSHFQSKKAVGEIMREMNRFRRPTFDTDEYVGKGNPLDKQLNKVHP
jgi:hypothetical protein